MQGAHIDNTKSVNQKKQAQAGIARENSRMRGRLQAIKVSYEVSRAVQAKSKFKAAWDSRGLQAKAQATTQK